MRRRSRRRRPSNGRARRSASLRAGAASQRTAATVSSANSGTLIGRSSVGLSPWPRTSKTRQWKPAACRYRTWAKVRPRFDSQPWTTTTAGPTAPAPPSAGTNQPASSPAPEGILDVLEFEPEIGRRTFDRTSRWVADPLPVSQREPICGRETDRDPAPCAAPATDVSGHGRRGRHAGPGVKSSRGDLRHEGGRRPGQSIRIGRFAGNAGRRTGADR